MIDRRHLTILYGKILTFAADEEGVILPFVVALMIALLGFATLATDVPRYLDFQTQLQQAADAFALAAAAELDGRSDAETRANNAISSLMAGYNSSVFGSAAVTPVATYYSAPPTSDTTESMTSGGGTVAATPQQAHYVQVTVTAGNITALFPAVLFGGATQKVTTSAVAVAGFSQTICQTTPIAICNGTGSTDMTNPSTMIGKEIVSALTQNSLPSGTLPSYDYVDTLGCGHSTRCLDQVLGLNLVPACNAVNNVTLIPGVSPFSRRYFDTRFDLYLFNAGNANQAQYSPDVNVRKGYAPGCNQSLVNTVNEEVWLPDDSNIAASDSSYGTSAFGNGNWHGSFTSYWTTNFPGVAQPATPATRYALYQYEIAQNLVSHVACGAHNPVAACPPDTPDGEQGTPQCAPVADAQANRRIIYAIVEDCSGSSVNLSAPLGVVKLFVLRPLNDTGGSMVSEYVDFAFPNSATDPVLHDNVQLIR